MASVCRLQRFSTGSFPQNKACERHVRAPVGTVPAPAPAPRPARRRLRRGHSPSAPTWAPTWAGDPPSEGRFPVPESTLKSREDTLTSSLGDACCRQELWLPRGSQGSDLGRGRARSKRHAVCGAELCLQSPELTARTLATARGLYCAAGWILAVTPCSGGLMTQPSLQAPAVGPPHCLEEVSFPAPGLPGAVTPQEGGTRGVRLGERSPDRGAHTLDRAWSLGSWVKCEDEVIMDALASPGCCQETRLPSHGLGLSERHFAFPLIQDLRIGVQDHVGRGSSVEPRLRTGGAGEPVAAPVAGPEGFQLRRAAVAMAAGGPGAWRGAEWRGAGRTSHSRGPLVQNNPADPDVPARGLERKDFGHGCQVCMQEALGQGRESRMAFWARISRLLLPGTASRRSTKTVPPQRSRVSGWSQPVHYLQIVAWIVFLILVFTTFGIFIPLLPPEWRYIAYSVTGGICLFHLLVHLIVLSIDPADANVRLKNYSRTVSTFDRSKHAHVIQRQYCHLCEVAVTVKAKHCSTCNKCVSGFDHHCKWLNNCVGSRNYWYFFTSVASAVAGLLCMVATLLYIFTQYFINPAGLRTDPRYGSISDQNTWLLLLPLFPVRTSTPVFLGIGALTLLLELVSLLLLGHLLLFHLYLRAKKLSTFEYIMQSDKQQSSKPLAVKRDVTPQRKGLSQSHACGRIGLCLAFHTEPPGLLGLRPLQTSSLPLPHPSSKKPKEFLPTSMHLSLCSATVKPEDTSSSKVSFIHGGPGGEATSKPTGDSDRIHFSPFLLPLNRKSAMAVYVLLVFSVKLTEQDPTINIPGESSSGLQELDGTLRSSTVGAKWKKFLLPPSRCSSVTSLRTICPESSLKLQDAKDRRDVRQHMEGDVAENQSSASGAQGPALTESPLQGSFSASRLPVESVPETHALLSSLRGQRKDTWSQKHWDVLPSSQKPWSLESTVINISRSCQEVPHVCAVAPYTQVPKGLPVIEEEEYGMKVTPVVSVEEGCSPEEATEPGSSTKVTMIIEPEDPEPEDRAAQPE
ncbi:uncharacterized protein LOC114891724 [Monodon monoceros]|uniref:uncharacterized protein LOC114891724 n=1 Tax=Monodon monoceros TaxID=40151 RepID=UPI0010F5634C|nr:uncharacterized protein LOC114891724 [Monodon monoceros]